MHGGSACSAVAEEDAGSPGLGEWRPAGDGEGDGDPSYSPALGLGTESCCCREGPRPPSRSPMDGWLWPDSGGGGGRLLLLPPPRSWWLCCGGGCGGCPMDAWELCQEGCCQELWSHCPGGCGWCCEGPPWTRGGGRPSAGGCGCPPACRKLGEGGW